jgi:DNA-binding transcriptional LysR family regulator
MNLQQFRFIRETIRRDFNLTEAARSLFTSQPGVSKAILEFEDELGVQIFERLMASNAYKIDEVLNDLDRKWPS